MANTLSPFGFVQVQGGAGGEAPHHGARHHHQPGQRGGHHAVDRMARKYQCESGNRQRGDSIAAADGCQCARGDGEPVVHQDLHHIVSFCRRRPFLYWRDTIYQRAGARTPYICNQQ